MKNSSPIATLKIESKETPPNHNNKHQSKTETKDPKQGLVERFFDQSFPPTNSAKIPLPLKAKDKSKSEMPGTIHTSTNLIKRAQGAANVQLEDLNYGSRHVSREQEEFKHQLAKSIEAGDNYTEGSSPMKVENQFRFGGLLNLEKQMKSDFMASVAEDDSVESINASPSQRERKLKFIESMREDMKDSPPLRTNKTLQEGR